MRLAALGLILGFAGCDVSPPPVEPRAATAVAAPSSPAASATEASASVSAPLPAAATASVEPAPVSAPAGVPAALYAPLFEEGRAWRFRSSLRLQTWSGPPSKVEVSRATGEVRCTVSAVTTRAWGVSSTITCAGHDDPFVGMPVAGGWAATRLGLHRVDEPIAEEPDERSLVIAAAPAPKQTKKVIDPEREGTWSKDRVFREGKGWCAETTYVDGDGGLFRACFEASRGFTSAAAAFEGGHSRQYEFVLAK